MSKIPLLIFEEHHEAFFVWNYAIMNKLIKPFNNTLLHVDEHSDMMVPKFNSSIKSLNDSLENLYQFTYNELSIANFIVPAIYQGMFTNIYWLYQSTNEGKGSEATIVIRSHNGEGKILVMNINSKLNNLTFFNPDYRNFRFKSLRLDSQFCNSDAIILDIDLDYFSCNPPYYHYHGKVEVTKEEYNLFQRDTHHFLRLSLGSGITAKTENGKYYFLFNSLDSEVIPSKLKVSEQEIMNRIDLFINFLVNNKVEPQMIDICKSKLSGFTPEDQCQFIEEKLIEKLSSIYDLDINHLQEIFKQEKLEMVA